MSRIMLLLLTSQAFNCLATEGLQFSLGESSPKWEGYDNNRAYRLAYVMGLNAESVWPRDTPWDINLEWALLHWEDALADDKQGGAITPMFRYHFEIAHISAYFEAGIGAAYMDDDQWADRKLGSRWMFEDKLAIGVILSRGHQLAFSWCHYSNAGLAEHNDGTNVFALSYGYFW